MIGIGIGLPFIKSGGNSAEAIAWKSYIEGNGGTISQALLDTFDTNFFIPAKANGNILTELDRLNIYCGLLGFEIAARTNLIKNAHYVTPVSSPTFDNNGYKSSGTSYLNLNYKMASQGVKYTQNNAFSFFTIKNPPFSSSIRGMGVLDSGVRADYIRASSGSSIFINSAVTATTNTNIVTSGFVHIGALRKSSTVESSLINTNKVDATNASVGLCNLDVAELAVNNNGSIIGGFDTLSHYASGHGSGNVDYAVLQTILNNLFTALGV